MDTTYGNRIPPSYRWAVTMLVLVPLAFLGWAAAAGLVSPTSAFLVMLLGVGFVAAYWKAGTTVSIRGGVIHLRLFPLWGTRVRFEQIQTVALEPIASLGREWGNRGSLRRDGEIFVDAGHSTTCLAVYLLDGCVIRLGMSSPEHAHTIATALPTEVHP